MKHLALQTIAMYIYTQEPFSQSYPQSWSEKMDFLQLHVQSLKYVVRQLRKPEGNLAYFSAFLLDWNKHTYD